MNRIINPAIKIAGTISVPGDKSISHRALILSAITEGTSKITHLSRGKDVQSTQHCFEQLGVQIENHEETVLIHGRGIEGFTPPKRTLDAGNSGTTMRLLSGILAAQPFTSTITGDASLCKRPMTRIIKPLRKMGANIKSNNNGVAPLIIQGTTLKGIDYTSPVASAQVKSCIILAGLHAQGKTTVKEPSHSRDHTERMLPCFGVEVIKDGLSTSVTGKSTMHSTSIEIPCDISSAAFFIAASALIKQSKLKLQRIGVNPTRTGIIKVLKKMGGRIQIQNQRIVNNEPIADIVVENSELHGTIIEGDLIPQVIDEIPLLAIVATQAQGKTVIRHAKELRVKETDRIAAVAHNLNAMGANCETFEDGFIIQGPQTLHGSVINTFGDHRIAMSFAIAGLIAQGQTVIQDAECAEISYPQFFELLEKLTHG